MSELFNIVALMYRIIVVVILQVKEEGGVVEVVPGSGDGSQEAKEIDFPREDLETEPLPLLSHYVMLFDCLLVII